MYSRTWALGRVQEHLRNHPRATEVFLIFYDVPMNLRVTWLQNGMREWEAYKYVIRNLENGLAIRKCPTRETPNDVSKGNILLNLIVSTKDISVSHWLLTAIRTLERLKKQPCVEIAGLPASDFFGFRDFDGQMTFEF